MCQSIYHEIQVKSYWSLRFKEGKPFIQGDFLNSNMCWCCFERCKKKNCSILTCDNQNVRIQKENMKKFSHVYNHFNMFKDIFHMKLSSKKVTNEKKLILEHFKKFSVFLHKILFFGKSGGCSSSFFSFWEISTFEKII